MDDECHFLSILRNNQILTSSQSLHHLSQQGPTENSGTHWPNPHEKESADWEAPAPSTPLLAFSQCTPYSFLLQGERYVCVCECHVAM